MNDEIKEFIEFRTDEDGTYFYYIDKNGDEQWSYNLDNLKDYITNLQQEIHKQIHTSIVQKKQINNLQKRNSRQRLANQKQQDLILKLQEGYCKLKEECNKGIYDCTMEEYHAMANKNMELSLENEDYKSRVEKAVEYINNYFVLGAGSDYQNNLLNILQNGSDEE